MRDLTGKVKGCPLCGSIRIYLEEINSDYIDSIKIKCADCGLVGYKNFTKSVENPVARTIEYWNTRALVNENH